MKRSQPFPPHRHDRRRAGLGKVEVIVTLFCLLLLVILTLPSLQYSREIRKRPQCLSHMRNLAVAIHNFASQHNAKVPLLVEEDNSWPIQLLPYLDQTALARELEANGETSKEELLKVNIPVFVCPDDFKKDQQHGPLSFVVNAGYGNFTVNSQTAAVTEVGTHTADIDWNGDGEVTDEERKISRATGVFWRPHEDGFRKTLEDITEGDGLGQTLLITENLNAGSWSSTETMDLGFVIGRKSLEFANEPDSERPLALQKADLGPFAINGSSQRIPGRIPAPSSTHEGIVNVMFCDGSGRQLSEDIDPLVYARLMTPNGTEYGQDSLPESIDP